MDTQYFELTKFRYLQSNLQEHHISIYQDQQSTLGLVRAFCEYDVAEGKYQDCVNHNLS